MKRTAIVLLALAAGLAGCGWATGPDFASTEAGFSARGGLRALTLRNASPHPVHYVALEEETSHMVDLNPNPAEWRSVQPGAEPSIPYSELDGYRAGAEWAVVHWWSQGTWGRLRVAIR
ncbi:MAG: hypothetical protein AVDCRST_MAG89-2985 [uncultured Gemmatimonadetes bacterium]|uniref:Uncharacterized protein n=1 Tax=uncultured Gemmatimonadota bacterium TaxID=203437 RepID=A0A6J4M2L6_9BACT|nr:MAG: hypothetical protein AVDCRST_MAG89-2985 [uncultured Gemmatimonadota bacterium]